ncbi:MAG: GDP-mannose 4,6-dehydratase [Thermodesulfobacteriota bacterium]
MKFDDLILVTGAAGFIGSHLTEVLLSQGNRVRAMVHYNFRNNWGWLEDILGDRMNQPAKTTPLGVLYSDFPGGGSLEVITGDIQDPFFVDKAVDGCKTVFHLAALIAIPYSYVAPVSYVSTNVNGTLNVLEACRKHQVTRLVHTSTSEVYGTAQYVPIDEKHPLAGQSPYSASKIGADHLAESFYRSFDLPVSIIRPFNTFGPRQSARAVIPAIIAQALAGTKEIRLGSIEPVRDLNYVMDTVAAFAAVASSGHSVGRAINIGRGEGISIGELAKTILQICGSRSEIVTEKERVRPEKSEVRELVCDCSLARELLGWKHRYSLQQGLEETVAWIRPRLHLYKPWIYNI